jgi:hypothetical protein
MGFATIFGLYGLLVLVPFILIYLFKPKPTDKIIPSLMFFLKEDKQKKKFSFLRRLLTDIVFFMQLIAIVALALSLAEPFMKVTKNAETRNSVLVVDVSESMQTMKDGKMRFDHAISEAKSKMHGKVSIVLASLTPSIVLENGLHTEASAYLSTLKPKESSTNIKGAMDLADTLLETTKGNVIVLSDFITTKDNDDPIVSKRLLNARGNSVQFVNFASKADNVGFVDIKVQKDYTDAYIKNFNEQEKTITVSLMKDNNVEDKKTILVGPRSKEKVTFATLPGLSSLHITPSDDLKADNVLYISSPLKDNIKVLLISNTIPKSIKSALEASKYIKAEVAEPPVIPDLNYDVVIVSNVKKEELLPGTFNDIKKYAEKRGNLIITAQDGIGSLETSDLLPVTINGVGNQSNTIVAAQNEVTKDIEFGVVKRYLIASPNQDALSFLNEDKGSSLIAYKTYGSGKIIYYGLFDDEIDFRFNPDYPIFWNNMINFMLNTEDINDYNFKIGEKSLVENAGFVNENGRQVAYNLADELEGDVSKDSSLFSKEYTDFVEKNVKEKYNFDMTMLLLALGSLILIAEILYIKYRGDL